MTAKTKSRPRAANKSTRLQLVNSEEEDNDQYADPHGLTFKQRNFIRAMLKGNSASEAYRQAYDCANMRPKNQRNEASRLLAHPVISRLLKVGFRRKDETALHSGASLRRFVEEKLVHQAQNADSDATKVRALELIGKLDKVASFKERVSMDTDLHSPEKIKAELEARLRVAFEENHGHT